MKKRTELGIYMNTNSALYQLSYSGVYSYPLNHCMSDFWDTNMI